MKKKVIIAVREGLIIASVLSAKCSDKCSVVMNNIGTQEEVIDITQRLKPDIVIVDDILIGEKNIVNFLKELKIVCSSCRIVLVTDCSDVAYVDKIAQIGVYDIFTHGSTDISYFIQLVSDDFNAVVKEKTPLIKGGTEKVTNGRAGARGRKGFRSSIAITGTYKTGKTFLANIIALQLSKAGRTVSLVDMSDNRTLYGYYCWGNDKNYHTNTIEALSKGVDKPFTVNSNMKLYTSAYRTRGQIDIGNTLQTLFSSSDIVVFDMDINVSPAFYKYLDQFYIVQDMDYANIIENTGLLKKLKMDGVDLKKAVVILNKYIECGITPNDIKKWICIEQGYVGNNKDSLIDNIPLFKVGFSFSDYIASLQKGYIGVGYTQRYTHELLDDINNIILNICPELVSA